MEGVRDITHKNIYIHKIPSFDPDLGAENVQNLKHFEGQENIFPHRSKWKLCLNRREVLSMELSDNTVL